MNSKQYIESAKEVFKNPELWTKNEIQAYQDAFINGDIEKIDEDFIIELKHCKDWETAEDIVKRYII